MVLIEIVGQKTKMRDSKTSRPKIQESETQRKTRKRDFETHSKRLRDFEIGTKISESLNFPDIIRHPYICTTAFIWDKIYTQCYSIDIICPFRLISPLKKFYRLQKH